MTGQNQPSRSPEGIPSKFLPKPPSSLPFGPGFPVEILPPSLSELETIRILKRLPSVYRALGDFKTAAALIPNQDILLQSLPLQEASDSSAIENIITTQDELYKASLETSTTFSGAAKEVQYYVKAMRWGYEQIQRDGAIKLSTIIEMQNILISEHLGTVDTNKSNTIESETNKVNANIEKAGMGKLGIGKTEEHTRAIGLRQEPGTVLRKAPTGELVYIPPQIPQDILRLMKNLEQYLNQTSGKKIEAPRSRIINDTVDPLIQMAVAHHQFETIHPFYDGNGRIGRMLNVLFLVHSGLLDLPVLYLSRSIIRNKAQYYNHLQARREGAPWEPWILYMLDAVESSAREGEQLLRQIRSLMAETEAKLCKALPKLALPALVDNLFMHPYTRIEFLMEDLGISRNTASLYLDKLVQIGILRREKLWRHAYFVHERLYSLLGG